MPNKTLIIAALSARGYAQAAVAFGYEVITLDSFADADTCAIAKQAIKLKFTEDVVDFTEFKHIFSMLDFSQCAGFLYGSLFDNAPELLAWVAESVSIIGNAPEVMRLAKSFEFFALLDDFGIPHPEVSLIRPLALVKQLGGAGGTHVQHNLNGNLQANQYFQQKIEGIPVSLLFIADGKTAQTVGFNLQFLSPTTTSPYRYAGAVSHCVLPERTQQTLEKAAHLLTKQLALRGCNSLDAIFDGEQIWVLELNPRLSASFHCYPNLMQAHIQACTGHLVALPKQTEALAHLVLYADTAIEVPADFIWPHGTMDIPNVNIGVSSVKIAQDAPICTICAVADTAERAHQNVIEIADNLKSFLYDKPNNITHQYQRTCKHACGATY